MATKKKASKKSTATKKRSTKTKSSSKSSGGKATAIENHAFAPGTKVGIHHAHEVTVERGLGRAPIPDPLKEVTVSKDGSLEVSGLDKGMYLAAGQVDGGRWRYFQFPVNLSEKTNPVTI